jgi:hypothetical protein
MLAGDYLGGFSGARQGRSKNDIPIFGLDCSSCKLYLFNSCLIHWDVCDSLQQEVNVPISLTVTEQP